MTTDLSYDAEVIRSKDRIPPSLEKWISQFNLKEIFAPNIYTVTTWTKNCSPVAASEENRAIACMDILLWLFYLDDYEKHDYDSFFNQCLAILDGRLPDDDMPQLFHAFYDVILRVASKGRSIEYFVKGRRQDIECYRWRNNLRQSKKTVTFDEYLSRRKTTIYITQWMDLWMILEDFCLLPDERNGGVIPVAAEMVISWHIFQNELVSVERDKISGDPNLVLLYKCEKKCSLKEAIEHIEQLRDRAIVGFANLYNSIRSKPTSVSQQCYKYLDLLNICLVGGVNNYGDNFRRYNTQILDALLAME